jgi:hypothetical protein
MRESVRQVEIMFNGLEGKGCRGEREMTERMNLWRQKIENK